MVIETKFGIGDVVYFPARLWKDEPVKVCSFEVGKISIFKSGIYYSTTMSGIGSVSEKECFSNEEDCKNYITHQREDKGE